MQSAIEINLSETKVRISKNKLTQILVISAVIALFINCFIFTYYNANPLVTFDGWRFIDIYLTPWYNDELNWLDLWKDHHPHPSNAILFITNATYFHLRMDYVALFSVAFSLLSVFLIWQIHNSITDTKEALPRKYGFIILTAALLCSLTSTVIYTWSLVTQGYIFIFFALLTLLSIEQLSRKQINIYRCGLYTLFITLLLIVYSDKAKILIYSSFIVMLLTLLLDRDLKWFLPIFSIIIAIIFQITFLNIIDYESQYSEISIISIVNKDFRDLVEYFLYVGTALLSAWVNIKSLTKITGASHELVYIFSCITFMTYIYTVYLYFKNRLYSKSIIPGTLVVTSILTSVAAATFRFNPDVQSAISGNMTRYYLHYVLGAIGISWIWVLHLQNKNIRKSGIAKNYLIIAIIIISQAFSSMTAWQSTPYRQKTYLKSANIMVNNANGDLSIKPPLFITGYNYPQPYLTGLTFLKKHNLNIFSDKNIIEKFEK